MPARRRTVRGIAAMDEAVVRAMLKWPQVPAVYGWLMLDRRGRWLVKTLGDEFEPIANRAVTDFIGRNYGSDESGRWFFQNGPQRVFVMLQYTPWVFALGEDGLSLRTHTDRQPGRVREAYLDDSGALVLATDIGVGVLLDWDLAAALDSIEAGGVPAEELAERVGRGEEVPCRLFGQAVGIKSLRPSELLARFGFDPRPSPPKGQPAC
jgi:hypothetical protein